MATDWSHYKLEKPTRLSKAYLSHNVDCTSAGQVNGCNGLCCRNRPTSQHSFYQEDEVDTMNLLPEKYKNMLVHDGSVYRIQTINGRCMMEDLCIEHPEIKSLNCLIFPFRVKNGLLGVDRFLWLHCPNKDKGEPIWICLKDVLIKIWGEEFYSHIVRFMTDPEFKNAKFYDIAAEEKKKKYHTIDIYDENHLEKK